MSSEFRIFDGTTQQASTSENYCCATHKRPVPETVTVSVGEVFHALADALASGKTWIKDFEDDEITIPFDLYEVILAYQHYQRLSA